MNVVIIDGRLGSSMELVLDHRRKQLGRFLIETSHGETVTVEVRGHGVATVADKWQLGDVIQVRGKLRTGGLVSADSLERVAKFKRGDSLQLRWPLAPRATRNPFLPAMPAVA